MNLDPELHFEKIVKNYDLLSYIIHPTSSQKKYVYDTALAFATGFVKQNDMMKLGTIMGIISMVLGFGLVYLMGTLKVL